MPDGDAIILALFGDIDEPAGLPLTGAQVAKVEHEDGQPSVGEAFGERVQPGGSNPADAMGHHHAGVRPRAGGTIEPPVAALACGEERYVRARDGFVVAIGSDGFGC